MRQEEMNISELRQDAKNFNRGSSEGAALLRKSFRKFGAGRSVLLDKHNTIIAGNKSAEAAGQEGIGRVRVVESDGKRLVVVRRTDLSIDSREGRELALADNATALVNLVWDRDMLDAAAEIEPEDWGVQLRPMRGVESRGEIDVEGFDETQTLRFRLTPEQYDDVASRLRAEGGSPTEALLKWLGWYDRDKQ